MRINAAAEKRLPLSFLLLQGNANPKQHVPAELKITNAVLIVAVWRRRDDCMACLLSGQLATICREYFRPAARRKLRHAFDGGQRTSLECREDIGLKPLQVSSLQLAQSDFASVGQHYVPGRS